MRFARDRLEPRLPGSPEPSSDGLRALEAAFVEEERAAVVPSARRAPREPDAFVRWFEALRETGPGQGDPLFPWLARSATLQQMKWFLAQEVAGEAGFDDLLALTQIKMPLQAKLELARNYWDEMGRGRASAMHGPLLSDLARALDVHADPETTVWESLALANLLVALAVDRRYAYHSIGALGAIELTAPTRVGHVDRGLARLGVPRAARRTSPCTPRWTKSIARPGTAKCCGRWSRRSPAPRRPSRRARSCDCARVRAVSIGTGASYSQPSRCRIWPSLRRKRSPMSVR